MNEQSGLSNKLPTAMQASREKYWSELNDAEKMERMRQTIKYLARRLEETSLELYHTKEAFLEHKHLGDDIVNRIKPRDLGANVHDVNSRLYRISDGEGDSVYF